MSRLIKSKADAFLICVVLMCVALITSNALETKQMDICGLGITGGLLVFPISYILNDCISEVWGWKKAKFAIWLAFAMNAFYIVFGAIADMIPGAPYWQMHDGFHAIFGLVPRIAFASLVAFICGSLVNAYVMVRMKGRSRFSVRAILSSLLGETCDSMIFFPIALGGVVPWKDLLVIMLSQVVLKTCYEIIILPVTCKVVESLKKLPE